MNREQRRQAARQAKKGGDDAVAEKIMLFNKMPDYCLTCEEPFDKQDREMVMTWHVIVDNKKEQVRLYCPTCMSEAQRILEDFNEHLSRKSDDESGNEEERAGYRNQGDDGNL